MLNLLAAEKIKLLRSKKLWIVLGILLLLPILQAANSQLVVHYGEELVQSIDTVINGATGILMMEKNGLTVLLVICVFISFFIGDEFQNGTIRNALSLGRSRTHFYLSKLTASALLTLIGAIVLTTFGMISYSITFGFGEIAEINHYFSYAVKTFITLYLLILANVSIYVMLSFLTKNSGVSMVWSFVYTIGTGFGAPVFQQTEHFKQITYWFAEAFLFYSDFANPADIARYPEMMLVSFITIVLSSIIGILLFTRTDIK
ncbi:ABC transporter permease [Paenibacillus contaminans]|uniref:ABC transporter permease n=1 Tax=Paenibacillus contaminans TaxID=450362 RepID=A0A329MTU1_9BACL|nr:ABC transporter permease [Paenibacillus contaminans]RAV23385.1 ABC transporter permease [Paenibacillus contaminans]